jgi:hypothetical protein
MSIFHQIYRNQKIFIFMLKWKTNFFFLFLSLFVASRFSVVSLYHFSPTSTHSHEHKKWFSNVHAKNSSQLFFPLTCVCEWVYRNDFLISDLLSALFLYTKYFFPLSVERKSVNVNKIPCYFLSFLYRIQCWLLCLVCLFYKYSLWGQNVMKRRLT